MTAAAIQAQLVDVRNIGFNKAIKLTLHVPAEQAALVMRAFGWPTMVDPVPVALARLINPAEEEPAQKPPPSAIPDKVGALRPAKKMAQRIGILCSDPVFQKFLSWKFGCKPCTEEIAAETVRDYCDVNSRSEIIWNTEPGNKWEDLYSDFMIWLHNPDLADAETAK